jgi:hypothetical protein
VPPPLGASDPLRFERAARMADASHD